MDSAMDLRVIKTREHIKTGFAHCLKQQTFTSITIKDICTVARINRSTLYKYYTDKYDLREKLIKETFDDLRDNFKTNHFQLDYDNLDHSLDTLTDKLQYMYSNKEWYTVLWNPNIELDMFQQMQGIFEDQIRKDLRPDTLRESNSEQWFSYKQELFVRLFAASAMTTIKWWYEQTTYIEPKEVAKLIINTMKHGMNYTFLQD